MSRRTVDPALARRAPDPQTAADMAAATRVQGTYIVPGTPYVVLSLRGPVDPCALSDALDLALRRDRVPVALGGDGLTTRQRALGDESGLTQKIAERRAQLAGPAAVAMTKAAGMASVLGDEQGTDDEQDEPDGLELDDPDAPGEDDDEDDEDEQQGAASDDGPDSGGQDDELPGRIEPVVNPDPQPAADTPTGPPLRGRDRAQDPESRILLHLRTHPPATAVQIAAALNLSRQKAAVDLARLAARHAVTKDHDGHYAAAPPPAPVHAGRPDRDGDGGLQV